jgi:hypothetical protein
MRPLVMSRSNAYTGGRTGNIDCLETVPKP